MLFKWKAFEWFLWFILVNNFRNGGKKLNHVLCDFFSINQQMHLFVFILDRFDYFYFVCFFLFFPFLFSFTKLFDIFIWDRLPWRLFLLVLMHPLIQMILFNFHFQTSGAFSSIYLSARQTKSISDFPIENFSSVQ